MMFVVIALIGTGWAFIKPFLGEKDKNIFLVVIPLQILANIAIIVLEETAPGSQGWFTWVCIPFPRPGVHSRSLSNLHRASWQL
jgi:hypothetical protein